MTRLVRWCWLLALLGPSVMRAEPVTYTGFTITSGQLGSWKFHNARVYLTVQGDTNDVQFMQFPDGFGGFADTYINAAGEASVTIVTAGKTVHARFAPGQIIVSSDLGSSDDLPHIGGRGIGFSSLTATGLEPAYPLGIEDGTIDWGDITDPGIASPALADLTTDLQSSTAFSGRSWSCVGFPDACRAPNPLQTNKGPLTLETPYSTGPGPGAGEDSLSGGFFIVDVGGGLNRPPRSTVESEGRGRSPITYRAYTVSDVQLGNVFLTAAQVYLTFEADAARVREFHDGPSSYGFINREGRGRVVIVTGNQVREAEIERGEVYVYYDVGSSAVGFGSRAGGRGSPLAVTSHQDLEGLVEWSSIGAVADLTRQPANAAMYNPATATLVTDLTNATTLSGAANSCVALDATTGVCSNFVPVGLRTSAGLLYLYESFTEDEQGNGDVGPSSINWGVFWAEPGQREDHDRDRHDDGRDDD